MDSSSILNHFRDLGLNLNSDWLAGLELVHEDPLTDDDVYFALMYSDLRESCLSTMRPYRSKFPKGSFLFQITSSEDISIPAAQRPRTSGSSNQRMLKFSLHSGPGSPLFAVELEHIPELQDCPDAGMKIVIQAEPMVINGILFIKKENVRIVGGDVASLLEMQTNDISMKIRSRDPLTYRNPQSEILNLQ
jgi:hypothetical protein